MKFPLTQGFYTARSVIANAQRCVNLYAEQNTPDAVFPYTFYPRPGYNRLFQMGITSGAARCNYVASNGALYRVIYDTVYYVDDAYVHTAIGTITAGTTPVYMADNGLAVLIVDGTANGYCIDLIGGTHAFGNVADEAFYGATRVDYVDTYFILNRPGTNQFYISLSAVSFENLTGTISPGQLYAAFDPLDIAAKAGWPDPLSGVIVMRREIWLIGEKTTEIWFNAGAADFTFQEMPGVFIEHGCIAPNSIWKQDVSIYWLSQDKEGRAIVIDGSQYAAKRISTHAIENEFASYETLSDAVGNVYQIEGHIFYKLTFPTEGKTWVYDKASGFWFEDVYTTLEGEENRSRGIFAVNAYQKNLESDWETGDLLELDINSHADVDAVIVFRRGFPHIMNDGKRISYSSFIADVSAGNATQQVVSLNVSTPGSNYATPPSVIFTGGGGTGASAQTYLSSELQTVVVKDGGYDYTTPPDVQIIGGGGTGATATASIANAVRSITLTNGGSAYTSVPTVSITGGGGSGSAAVASLTKYVSAISVSAAGNGYQTAPDVVIAGGGGSGATATANLTNGVVTGVTLASGGTGYSSAPTVTISGGGGTGATATATLTPGGVSGVSIAYGGIFDTSSITASFSGGGGSGVTSTVYTSGLVKSISVTNPGSGYSVPPTITISGGGGSGATAIFGGWTATGLGVASITVGKAGSNYTSIPTVSITGVGSGATAVAVIGYTISSIVIVNPGSGYTSAPTVSFTPSVYTDVTAYISSGGVGSLTLTAGGSGYTSAPALSFSGGGGTGAAGTATISAGVGSVTVTDGGSGYSFAPTISFVSSSGAGATATSAILGNVGAITLTNPGTDYTSAPAVTISGGGGSGATATATISSRVVAITITNPGEGYTSSPSIYISGGGGTGATATATLSGGVIQVIVTNGGYGYTSEPVITFVGGGGSGAAASATIGFVTPQINLRWSDTRGVTWSSALEQTMGAQGKYYTQPQWNRLGYGRDRVFELFWSCPSKHALNGAWVDTISMGS